MIAGAEKPPFFCKVENIEPVDTCQGNVEDRFGKLVKGGWNTQLDRPLIGKLRDRTI